MERIGPMDSPRRVIRRTVELGKKYLFLMEDKPHGWELQNSFDALGETDSEQEIPLASCDDFPSTFCQIECERKVVPKGGRFNTQTQKQK